MNNNVLIIIPTYKRPGVIDKTLKNLIPAITQNKYIITLCVYDNKSTIETKNIIESYRENIEESGIKFITIFDEQNIGKAGAITYFKNNIFTKDNYEYVITMDNDIVIDLGINLLESIDIANENIDGDWEMVAPRTPFFTFEHNSLKNSIKDCVLNDNVICKIRPSEAISGAIMIMKNTFFDKLNFPLKDIAMLGGDDGYMCGFAKKKYVLQFIGIDYARHDPLCGGIAIEEIEDEQLKNYQLKKNALRFGENIWDFPKDWDG